MSRIWRQDLWILEIINCRRVKNLIISRDAIPLWIFGHNWTLKLLYVLSTMGVSKESISKFLIGNRFHVKLRILSPENCKQSLQVKSWKAEVIAEKKQTQDYNRNFVIQAHKS